MIGHSSDRGRVVKADILCSFGGGRRKLNRAGGFNAFLIFFFGATSIICCQSWH